MENTILLVAIGIAALLGLLLFLAAAAVALYAVREMSESGRRQQEFFTEYADRLMGLRTASSLAEKVPEPARDPADNDPIRACADLFDEARSLGYDLHKPEDVSRWNELVEQAWGAKGLLS